MNDETIVDDLPRRRERPRVPPPHPVPSNEDIPTTPQSAGPTGIREEDPRTRAARRAAELRDHLGTLDEGVDEFFIDKRAIPDGWDYEWKRKEVLGKADPAYEVSLRLKGWEPVPASRHPEMMPDSNRGETIERKGMILMERPKEITDEVRNLELRKARAQVRQKEQQLNGAPAGQNSAFDVDNKGTPMVKIRKSYEPMPVPEK